MLKFLSKKLRLRKPKKEEPKKDAAKPQKQSEKPRGVEKPGFWKFNILLWGKQGVGTTALQIRFCDKTWTESYDPFQDIPEWRHVQLDGEDYKIEVLAAAGQHEYVALFEQWIRTTDGILYVYDISSRASFTAIETLQKTMQGCTTYDNQPAFLLGNKKDLPASAREVSHEEGQMLASRLGIGGFMELTAKSSDDVDAAFLALARMIRDVKVAKGYRGSLLSRLR